MNGQAPDMEVLSSFLDEAGQCVATLNGKLLEAEKGDALPTVVDEMFRAAHSMKGSAGFLNLTDVAAVTHSLETVLDWVRKGKLTFNPAVVDALFQAFDLVSSLLAQIACGEQGQVDIAPVVTLLNSVLGVREEKKEANPEDELGPLPDWMRGRVDIDDVLETMIARNSGKRIYALRLPLRDVFAWGHDLIELYHDLEHAVHVQTAFAVADHPDSPWLPLGNYAYDVGLLCFSKIAIEDALGGLDIPVSRAWELSGGDMLPEPVFLGRSAGDEIGQRVDRLEVRPDMEKHRATWVSETGEELEQLDAALISYEKSGAAHDEINHIFRLMHRIKGSSASMGLQEMARVAHNAESLLSVFREREQAPGAEAFAFLFHTKDFFHTCLARIRAGETEAPQSLGLDAEFVTLREACKGQDASDAHSDWEPSAAAKARAADIAAGRDLWKLGLRLKDGTPLPDLRYLMILRELEKQADLIETYPSVAELERGCENPPPLQAMLASSAPEAALRAAVDVDMVGHYSLERMALPQAKPQETGGSSQGSAAKTGASAGAALTGAKPAGDTGGGQHADTVRVDTSRLDQMMNIAGELVITKARVSQLAESMSQNMARVDLRAIESLVWHAQQVASGQADPSRSERVISPDRLRKLEQSLALIREMQDDAGRLRDTAVELHRHTGTMQNSVMKIRMVPIGPLFQRFHRLVRDLCKQRDRNARLELAGEGTELDKKLIDELTDPLTHLIRNGMDHGLESPADRAKAGKPEQGIVRLEAFHEGGQICVRVSDDGRGLDEAKIRAKAVTNGLLDEAGAARLSREETFQLIFQPGFSTAEKVTDISGRGVGMDIVKSKIGELKGKIDIDSRAGVGTSFTIRLPLTLAMINALLVRIGQTRYAFALESVREIVDMRRKEIQSVEGKGRVIRLREDIVALVDLNAVMDADPLAQTGDVTRAVIIRGAGQMLAVAVDHVIGEEEIVVKALSEEVAAARGISGATVLGDGGIALILDAGAIMELAGCGGGWRGAAAGEEHA